MATLLELASSDNGPLFKLNAGLDADEQEHRLFYATRKLMEWLQKDLLALKPFHERELSPVEQMADLLATYASGLPLVFEQQFKTFPSRPLKPIGDGVWYL